MQYAYKNKFVRLAAEAIDFLGGIFFYTRPKIINKNEIKKILVAKLDNLGDCFLMTPLFEYLKKNTRAEIDIICMAESAQIFLNNPNIKNVITLQNKSYGELRKVSKELRKNKYDLYIDARGEAFAALLGYFSKIKTCVGFEKEEWGSFFYTNQISYDRNKHETEKYRNILNIFNIEAKEWKPKIFEDEAEKIKIDEFIKNNLPREFIAVSPGAGAKYKIWPTENYTDLMEKIANEDIYDIVLLGANNEIDICTDAAKNAPKALIMAGKLSIRESYVLLSKARMWVGNDSFLAHVAASHNIKSIELMNASVDKKRWEALGDNTAVIVGKSKNHSCMYGNEYPCQNMNEISVNQIYELYKRKI